jgi:hypothetical protein
MICHHLQLTFYPLIFEKITILGINILNEAALKIQKIARGRIGRSQVAKLLAKKKKKKTGGKKKKAT